MEKKLILLACLLVLSSYASATYTYGTNLNGTSVVYESITADDPVGTNPLPLWGTMQISGDSLLFFPTDFEVGISGAGGNNWVDETLQFTLAAKPGQAENRWIDSILFAEAGHYTLSGIGTDVTNANVTCGVIITIMEIDGTPVVYDPLDPFKWIIDTNLTFTSDGTYELPGEQGTLVNWSGSLNHVFGIDYITKVNVSINNYLEVNSQDGTTSFIEKKVAIDQPSVTITPTIPEPATLALLGLGGLLLRKRRK